MYKKIIKRKSVDLDQKNEGIKCQLISSILIKRGKHVVLTCYNLMNMYTLIRSGIHYFFEQCCNWA